MWPPGDRWRWSPLIAVWNYSQCFHISWVPSGGSLPKQRRTRRTRVPFESRLSVLFCDWILTSNFLQLCYCAPTPSSRCSWWSTQYWGLQLSHEKIAFSEEADTVSSPLDGLLGTWTWCWSYDPHKQCFMYIRSAGRLHDLFVTTHTQTANCNVLSMIVVF